MTFYVDEYEALHDRLAAGDYEGAMAILNELDEMSKDEKIGKIESFMKILLIHLIKYAAERPREANRSWDRSIRNSRQAILKINRRRKSGGHYLSGTELSKLLSETWSDALADAADEVHDGRHTAAELEALLAPRRAEVLGEALRLITTTTR